MSGCEPVEWAHLRLAAVRDPLNCVPPRDRVMAALHAARVLEAHGWRFPCQLPVDHIAAMLAAERRYHDRMPGCPDLSTCN